MRNTCWLQRELTSLKHFAISLCDRVDRLEKVEKKDFDNANMHVLDVPVLNTVPVYVNGSTPRLVMFNAEKDVYYLKNGNDITSLTCYHYDDTFGDIDHEQPLIVYNGYIIAMTEDDDIIYMTDPLDSSTYGHYPLPSGHNYELCIDNGHLYVTNEEWYIRLDDFPNTSYNDAIKIPILFYDCIYTTIINDYIYAFEYVRNYENDDDDQWLLYRKHISTEVVEYCTFDGNSMFAMQPLIDRGFISYSAGQYVILSAVDIYVSVDGVNFTTVYHIPLEDDWDKEPNEELIMEVYQNVLIPIQCVPVSGGFIVSGGRMRVIETEEEEPEFYFDAEAYFAKRMDNMQSWQKIYSQIAGDGFMPTTQQVNPNITLVTVFDKCYMFTNDPVINTVMPSLPTLSINDYTICRIRTRWWNTSDTRTDMHTDWYGSYEADVDTLEINCSVESSGLVVSFPISRRGNTYSSLDEAGIFICAADNISYLLDMTQHVKWNISNGVAKLDCEVKEDLPQRDDFTTILLVYLGPIPGVDA